MVFFSLLETEQHPDGLAEKAGIKIGKYLWLKSVDPFVVSGSSFLQLTKSNALILIRPMSFL